MRHLPSLFGQNDEGRSANMLKILILCVLVTVASCVDSDELESLKQTVNSLTRQLMMQQFYVEEMTRSSGDSGIKQTRVVGDGTRPYHTNTHTRRSFASIHDHANNDRTVGLGEFIAVLNGLEFRTRHNDYRLNMPHPTSPDYHAVVKVPFPPVPPAVLSRPTLQAQIDELQMWFAAWGQQNHTVRDYRPYFKPILCYLEGAWTTNTKTLEESFFSDRHRLDASSWFDMQEKVRFTSYTGTKSNLENYAYLPTKIMNIINGTIPQFAQWNYRILCHPLKNDIPLKSFRVVDDFSSRMASKTTIPRHQKSRAARFTLNPNLDPNVAFIDKHISYGIMDKLMGEIPGKSNYAANISDSSFGNTAYDISARNENKILNTAFYHRIYKSMRKDAMGLNAISRGFSDANLWVAETTQPRIAPLRVADCKGGGRRRVCNTYEQRVSYAIPLEIIYLTPLSSWNPYHVADHDPKSLEDRQRKTARIVTDGGRNGGATTATAYNGTHSRLYYRTPIEFFQSTRDPNRNPADTTRGKVCVLDSNGVIRNMTASGTRAFLPSLPGIGALRTRWPIAPVHAEGNTVYKELTALADLVMHFDKYRYLMSEPPEVFRHHGHMSSGNSEHMEYELATSTSGEPHTHNVELFSDEIMALQAGQIVQFFTTSSEGHMHDITVRMARGSLRVIQCDGRPRCPGGHPSIINRIEHDH